MAVAKRPSTQAGPNPRPRNMRSFIPLTKHTNINNFPKIDYKRFPLMPVDKEGKPFHDEYGKVIRLYDEDEEAEFRAANPTMADVPDSPQTQADELTRLREENARLKAERDAPAIDPAPSKGADDKIDPNGGIAGLVQPASTGGGKQATKKTVEPKLPD